MNKLIKSVFCGIKLFARAILSVAVIAIIIMAFTGRFDKFMSEITNGAFGSGSDEITGTVTLDDGRKIEVIKNENGKWVPKNKDTSNQIPVETETQTTFADESEVSDIATMDTMSCGCYFYNNYLIDIEYDESILGNVVYICKEDTGIWKPFFVGYSTSGKDDSGDFEVKDADEYNCVIINFEGYSFNLRIAYTDGNLLSNDMEGKYEIVTDDIEIQVTEGQKQVTEYTILDPQNFSKFVS